MKAYITLTILLLSGCSSNDYYRVSCNKHVSGAYISYDLLMKRFEGPGFNCNNNGTVIQKITNEEVLDRLDN